MSLVAYETTSDSENELSEEENESFKDATQNEVQNTQLNLPAPKKQLHPTFIEIDRINMNFKLPEPIEMQQTLVIEEDDEFLKKKEIPTVKPPKGPVKITIPSLDEFKDVKEYINSSCDTPKNRIQTSSKILGLLSSLPKPKGEQLFEKETRDSAIKTNHLKPVTSMVPYSLMEHSKLDLRIGRKKNLNKIGQFMGGKEVCYSDSDSDDNESVDFFSLNKQDDLPIVTEREIKVMVAKKTMKLAEVSAKFAELTKVAEESYEQQTINEHSSTCVLEEEAINHLLGSSAKRRRNQTELMNVVDISHEQVMPDRNTWIRNALAQSTQYTPKGKTNDEELIPGSKRKHQITYLAHQAKTNETELQAMWANNRQTRRQTQSKYGF